MRQKGKIGLLFIFVAILIILHSTRGIAQFRVAPLGDTLRVDSAEVSGDGSLVIADKGLCCRTDLVGHINASVNILRYRDARKAYLTDESFPSIAENILTTLPSCRFNQEGASAAMSSSLSDTIRRRGISP
jgi:hypothetical protein